MHWIISYPLTLLIVALPGDNLLHIYETKFNQFLLWPKGFVTYLKGPFTL